MDLQTWVLHSHHLHAGAVLSCTHSCNMHTERNLLGCYQDAPTFVIFGKTRSFKVLFPVSSHTGEYRLPGQGDDHKFQQERPQHYCKD